MKKIVVVLLIFLVLGSIIFFMQRTSKPTNAPMPEEEIRYAAIGDSYTIGEGVGENERYPNILVNQLQEKGTNIKLIANPSVTGYTIENAIEYEVPVLADSNANFVTVLLGANNLAQGQSAEHAYTQFVRLLDDIQEHLPEETRIVVITVPDFLSSPAFVSFRSPQTTAELEKYNRLISAEAQKRGLEVADIYPITQNLENDPELFVSDGLHPSGIQYQEWAAIILPVVEGVINK